MYTLPPITTISSLPKQQQTELLNNLFEPHQSIISYLQPLFLNSYSSYDQFVEAAHSLFSQLDPHCALAKDIISSHPRLGLPRGTELSEHSSQEQKRLQSDDATVQEFTKLNKEYEVTFPGLKFVSFVNGRGRDEMKLVFKKRIERGDYVKEVQDAIKAMCDIALDRVNKLQSKL